LTLSDTGEQSVMLLFTALLKNPKFATNPTEGAHDKEKLKI